MSTAEPKPEDSAQMAEDSKSSSPLPNTEDSSQSEIEGESNKGNGNAVKVKDKRDILTNKKVRFWNYLQDFSMSFSSLCTVSN